jgi:hypothetical protein
MFENQVREKTGSLLAENEPSAGKVFIGVLSIWIICT